MYLKSKASFIFLLALEFVCIEQCISEIAGNSQQGDYKRCGINNKLDRGTGFIFQGEEDGGPGAWPWLVSIGQKVVDEWKHSCGGTLITQRHVLTAAHCALQMDAKIRRGQVMVRAGDGNLQQHSDNYGVQMVTVSSYKTHPRYKRPLRYFDIGLLHLSAALSLTAYVRTICPPSRPTLRHEDNQLPLVVAGWGSNSESQVGKNIESASVQVYSESYCNSTHLGQERFELAVPHGFTEDLFCGGYPAGSEGVCYGDSGSPVVLFLEKNWVLKGVVSGGLTCGTSFHPNIYVRLGSSHVLNWVHKEVSASLVAINKPPLLKPVLKKPAMQQLIHQNTGWSTWSSWSKCNQPCGVGKKYRKRLCDGKSCTHKEQSQERLCNWKKC